MIYIYEALDEQGNTICFVPTSIKDEDLAHTKIKIKTKRESNQYKLNYVGIKL